MERNKSKELNLLWCDGGGSIAIGVVDQSVERLVNPLPEHYSRNCPTWPYKMIG